MKTIVNFNGKEYEFGTRIQAARFFGIEQHYVYEYARTHGGLTFSEALVKILNRKIGAYRPQARDFEVASGMASYFCEFNGDSSNRLAEVNALFASAMETEQDPRDKAQNILNGLCFSLQQTDEWKHVTRIMLEERYCCFCAVIYIRTKEGKEEESLAIPIRIENPSAILLEVVEHLVC